MESATPQPPSKRREEVRADVRAAMLELLKTKPFKDLTIDEIAGAAGLSRTAFYFYFKNKTEVLAAVMEEVAVDLYAEADRWYSGDGPPEQLVREGLDGAARVYAEHAEIMRVAAELATYDQVFAGFYRRLIQSFVEAASQHIREEQQAGRARDIDAEQVAESLVYMFERCCQAFISVDGRPVEPVVDALTAIWMHAVYPDEALGA